jgi:transposase
MAYSIAGIDVHKKMLAAVVADVTVEGEYVFEQCSFSTSPEQLRLFAAWLREREVQEAVMESTAQYWRPVWEALERYWKPGCRQREGAGPNAGALYLAQATSNRAPRGRKRDFADAERLLRRLVAQELVLSFVPSPEQRLWRTVTRRKQQLIRDRVRLQNQLECFLEEAHIKLSSFVSDLLGQSGRRMLAALAQGEKDPMALAALADRRLRASSEQLCDALGACAELDPIYRQLLQMSVEELQGIEGQMKQLDQILSRLLESHQEAVKRLAEVPGLGVESAHQIIAEIGPTAATFPSAKQMASWIGVCPGQEESAGNSRSSRSPKGNRGMRRILNQAAHAAIKVKGCIFEVIFQRLKHRLKYQEAIWAIAHRLCRVIWKLLHDQVRYQEHGPSVSAQSQRTRAARMARQLRAMGYRVDPPLSILPA